MDDYEKIHQLHNVDFGRDIGTYVKDAFTTGVNSDIDIICNNVTFKCHKVPNQSFSQTLDLIHNTLQVILMMQCKQLRALVTKDHDVLMIPDIHEDSVKKLLTFLYIGVLDVSRKEVGDFLGLIEQWGISPEVTFQPKEKVNNHQPKSHLSEESHKTKHCIENSFLNQETLGLVTEVTGKFQEQANPSKVLDSFSNLDKQDVDANEPNFTFSLEAAFSEIDSCDSNEDEKEETSSNEFSHIANEKKKNSEKYSGDKLDLECNHGFPLNLLDHNMEN